MTGPVLLDYAAPSGVEMLVAWLSPLTDVDGREVGAQRPSGATLPYSMVQSVAGANPDKISMAGIYQIDDFAATYKDALRAAQLTERRVLALGPPLAPQRRVTLTSGQVVFADSVTTSVSYHWLDFGENTVFRFVSRYAIDLRMVAI